MNQESFEVTLTNKEASLIRTHFSHIKYDSLGNNHYINQLRIAAYKVFPNRLIKQLEQLNPLVVERK
jgi:hypothetical protein